MSQTLVCLTESFMFHAQDIKTEITNTSVDGKTFKSDVVNTMQIFHSVNHDNQTQDTSIEGTTEKHTASRKREATSVLMECVKRRDISRTCDFEINVPLPQSNQETPLRTSDCYNSRQCNDMVAESISLMDTSNPDLSDSGDSGVDTLSKASSPCQSIEDTLSGQEDDTGVESPALNTNIDDDPLPESVQQQHSQCQKCRQSPSAIYEDLKCLHLTEEETVLPQEKDIKSPISKSLFNNVASTIYFSLKDEKVAPMPDHVLALMKWRLSNITPVIIKELLKKCGFVLLDANTTEEWLGTWGKHLKCASFKRIKGYQKVNHYPGSFHLGRKDKLWENYKHMQGRFGSEDFNFFPETYYLPNDMNLLKSVWQVDEEKCWILKPPASARGTGVKVIFKWSQVPKNRPVMVQRYLTDPYLINGTKFDLRIYVFVSSIEPLRVYVFEDGLVRFASEKFSLSNASLSNRFVHLTNYSINRRSSSYTSNEDENSCQGHKWTLKSFWTYMINSGINIEGIQESITDMIIKTIICAETPISRLMKMYARSTYNCYELFGFDIMLDKNLRPWLLEVNISPSLHSRSLLDYTVKGQMVKDMMNMVGFQVPETLSVSSTTSDYGILSQAAIKYKALRNRCLSPEEREKHSVYTFNYEKVDILNQLTPDDVRCLIESEDEYNRKGAFTRIFPSTTSSKYFVYFEHFRYYNLLLDAWEKKYHNNREEGIQYLQELCDKKVHLQTCIVEPSNTVTEKKEVQVSL